MMLIFWEKKDININFFFGELVAYHNYTLAKSEQKSFVATKSHYGELHIWKDENWRLLEKLKLEIKSYKHSA